MEKKVIDRIELSIKLVKERSFTKDELVKACKAIDLSPVIMYNAVISGTSESAARILEVPEDLLEDALHKQIEDKIDA